MPTPPTTTPWVPMWPAAAAAVAVLPADTVIPAATRIIANKLLAGDANAAWRVLGDGKMEWGPGGAGALDTNLYRSGARLLATDSTLQLLRGPGAPAMQIFMNAGEANASFKIDRDGSFQYGPGGAGGADINFGRSAARVLATDATLRLDRGSGAKALEIRWAAGDTYAGLGIDRDGSMQWGAGGASGPDTNLYRSAAGELKTDSFLNVQGVFKVQYGRAYTRYGTSDQIAIGDKGGDGATPCIVFGSAADTNLYRQQAGVLATDGALAVGALLWSLDNTGNNFKGIAFGTSQDVRLYRSAASVLKTDAAFWAGEILVTGHFRTGDISPTNTNGTQATRKLGIFDLNNVLMGFVQLYTG